MPQDTRKDRSCLSAVPWSTRSPRSWRSPPGPDPHPDDPHAADNDPAHDSPHHARPDDPGADNTGADNTDAHPAGVDLPVDGAGGRRPGHDLGVLPAGHPEGQRPRDLLKVLLRPDPDIRREIIEQVFTNHPGVPSDLTDY
ncbi:hypothetical protein [Actinomadura sp. NPDC048394]|uniref:hypothetical protein n=1 Tax=Actinomadura sp. NPDC048394 TaxID=3158223 RepID=UPI0033F88BE9